MVHELPLFAVGHQTNLESGRGSFGNAATMDLADADRQRDLPGRNRPRNPAAQLFRMDAFVFLAARVLLRNS